MPCSPMLSTNRKNRRFDRFCGNLQKPQTAPNPFKIGYDLEPELLIIISLVYPNNENEVAIWEFVA